MSFIKLEEVNKVVKEQKLLNNVSLEINEGDIATLQGINGSGKTVLLKAILGLIRTNGTVEVAGSKVKVQDKYPIKAGITIENPSIIENFSAYKNL